ncbi:aspartic peptidase domain-containing protein [Xylariaceae sp. FL0255]|nr:aspartic peptidase domain-containing protein [Xylariaceae sp. FL0255]
MMSNLNFFLLAAFLLTLFTPSVTGTTASIPLSHNADAPRHGPSEVLRTLIKYNQSVPDGLQRAVDEYNARMNGDADVGGIVPAQPMDGDLEWIEPIDIGTPPQKLFLDLDTGSSDTWVFSTETKASEVENQTLWSPVLSSTSELIRGCNWSILYGDFSTSSGSCYRDTFALGNLTIENMTIQSAESVSDMFSKSSFMSGLAGLGWPALRQTVPLQKSLLQFLPDVLTDALFTVDLRHNSSDGSFNFGFINDSLHTGNISYTDIDNSLGFWAVNHTAFGINGINLTWSYLTPQSVIMDTGTTLLFAPKGAVDTYYMNVTGAYFDQIQYGYCFPCGPTDPTPPDFLWVLEDQAGNTVKGFVPGEYVVYDKVTDDNCYGGIQSIEGFPGVDGIFGDIFLKSNFMVFDITGQRVGIAPKPLSFNNTM